MTQKRILRANTKKVARERDLLLRDAFRLFWVDLDDPEVENLLSELVTGDPTQTTRELFEMVNKLLDEVVETTGETRDAALARLQRG